MRRLVFALAAVAALGVTLPANAQYVLLDPGRYPGVDWVAVPVPVPVYRGWWVSPFPYAYPYYAYRHIVQGVDAGGY